MTTSAATELDVALAKTVEQQNALRLAANTAVLQALEVAESLGKMLVAEIERRKVLEAQLVVVADAWQRGDYPALWNAIHDASKLQGRRE